MANQNRKSEIENRKAVVALLAFAFLLRVAFLFLAGVNAPLTGDEFAYQQIAENLAAGRGFFQTNNPFFPGQVLYAWQAPLYPLLLGALEKFVGGSVAAAKLFGILVSTATVYVVYDLTRRVFRAPLRENVAEEKRAHHIALAAGLLVAIYPGFLTLAHLLLSEGLFIFLVMLAFDFVARGVEAADARKRTGWIVAAGVAWGLATLTRGLTLYFTPLLAVWLAWVVWRTREHKAVGDHPSHSLETGAGAPLRAIGAAVLFVIVTGAVIAPWTARNYFQFGQLVLLETKGGVNLWLGNSPYTPYEFIRNVWKVGVREPILNELPQDELQRDRAAYTLALNYLRAEPFAALARVPSKFADFWGFERNLVDIAEATRAGGGWNSLPKIGADLFAAAVYIFVMVCGVAGFCYARDDVWKLLFGAFIVYFVALHLLIFGDGRFHLPLIPLFAMYAAWLLIMRQRIAYTPTRTVIVAALVLLLSAVWARETWVACKILL